MSVVSQDWLIMHTHTHTHTQTGEVGWHSSSTV